MDLSKENRQRWEPVLCAAFIALVFAGLVLSDVIRELSRPVKLTAVITEVTSRQEKRTSSGKGHHTRIETVYYADFTYEYNGITYTGRSYGSTKADKYAAGNTLTVRIKSDAPADYVQPKPGKSGMVTFALIFAGLTYFAYRRMRSKPRDPKAAAEAWEKEEYV